MKAAPSLTPALDGVRGLAFLTVLLSHCNDYTSRPLFLSDGQVGVWLFFVLSSFLLARPWFEDPAPLRSPATWLRYLVRRLLRIYPLFLLYLVPLWLVAHVPLSKCLRILVLDTVHGVDWSLFVEFRFYLLLPVLMLPLALGLGRRLHLAFLAVLILLGLLAFPFWRPHHTWLWAGLPVSGWTGNAWFLSYLGCFLVGMVAAAFAAPAAAAPGRARHWGDFATLLGLASLLMIPLARQYTDWGAATDYAVFAHLWFPFSALFALWICLLCRHGGAASRLLSLRPLRFLGAISYPGYLSHVFVLHAFKPLLPHGNLVFVLCSIGATLLCSWLLHVTVEKPLYRLRPAH